MAAKKIATAGKPRILVVGGEARNLGSKKLKDLFEIVLVDKKHKKIPAFTGEVFDAMVLLRFISPDLIRKAKEWADEKGLPRVEVRSIGQCPLYLANAVPSIKAYLDAKDGAASGDEEEAPSLVEAVKAADEAQDKGETPQPSGEISDDDLWESYGEKFVSDLKGFTKSGEVYTPEDFKNEIIKYLTGLNDDPMVDRLTRMLIPRGVISMIDGKVVVGDVADLDYEKVRKHIAEMDAAKPVIEVSRPDSVDKTEDEDEEASGNKENGSISEARREFLERILLNLTDGWVYQDMGALFVELHKAGLHHPDKRPLSPSMMRVYVNFAEDEGIIKRIPTGVGRSFRLRIAPPATPGNEPQVVHTVMTPPPTASIPEVAPPPPPPVRVPAPAPISTPAPQAITPVDASKIDLGNEESVFDAVEATFPNKSWPSIMSFADVARVLKSAMYEQFWNEGAARTTLSRIRVPINRPNIDAVIKIKNAFLDEQWTYLAMGYFKDRTVSELMAVLRSADKFWRTCQDCEQDFMYHMPRRCRDCNAAYRGAMDAAKPQGEKGGS